MCSPTFKSDPTCLLPLVKYDQLLEIESFESALVCFVSQDTGIVTKGIVKVLLQTLSI